MQRTIALWVAYDGTEFHGWQDQPGLRTVQDVLQQSLRRVVRHPVNLIGCGRTDAGVHAAGHVSHFVTHDPLEVGKLKHAIGSRLPLDLSIVAVRDVHPTFDARRAADSKLYRYRIHHSQHRPVQRLAQRYMYHCWHALNVEPMKQAARHFVGEHDFSAMAARGCERESMVRRVLRCDVERHLDEIRIDVEGTGFLHKQVRNMVGTLLEVGRGQWPPDCVTEILDSLDRANGGPTAPAHGLCMQWVRYPPRLLRKAPAEAEAAG